MLSPEVDAFLEMLVATRGAAKNTIEAYRQDLECFSVFLKEASPSQSSLLEVTPQQINGKVEKRQHYPAIYRLCANSINFLCLKVG